MGGAPRYRFLTTVCILALAIGAIAAAPGGAPVRARAAVRFGASPNVKQFVVKFVKQGVGSASAPQVLTLSSTGTAALDIFSIATTGDFAQTNNCGTSLPSGQSCNISVSFVPTQLHGRSGFLTVTSNAVNSPLSVPLKGVGAGPKITTLSASSLAPLAPLQISGAFMATSGQTTVVFRPRKGNPVSVPATQISSGSVVVSVPPLMDSSGNPVAGPVRVQLSEKLPSGSFISNTKGILNVQALPAAPPLPAGTVTLGFIQGAANTVTQVQQQIKGTPVDSPGIEANLTAEQQALSQLATMIQPVVNGSAASVDLGSFAGTEIVVGQAQLQMADRMLVATLQALANPPTLNEARYVPQGAARPQQETTGCPAVAQSAQDTLNVINNGTVSVGLDQNIQNLNAATESCSTLDLSEVIEIMGGAVFSVAVGFALPEVVTGVLALGPNVAMILAANAALEIEAGTLQTPGMLPDLLDSLSTLFEQFVSEETATMLKVSSFAGMVLDAVKNAVDASSGPPAPTPTSTPTQTATPAPTPTGCTSGQTLCNGVCVDTNTDAGNCGGCGSTCAFGGTCQAGVCGCPAGESSCFNSAGQSTCVDTFTDNNNCGGCFNACASGQSCSNGTCINGCSGTTPTNCSGTCTDTQTDSLNCGSCGNVCPNNERCSGGSCVCYDPDATTDPGEDPDCE